MTILQTRSLTKTYQMGEHSLHALREVDLSIEKGDFVAVMGPSGSGKSTLLHMLGGLDQPTSGEVILAGQSLSELSDNEITRLRRQKIGFIFQFYNLLPTLTTRENVGLPLLIDGQALRKQGSWIEELLGLVNLEDRVAHRPDQLSGGQQQRVAIARAFVNHPEIVLADEPTGNLDTRAGTVILELLQRSCAELGMTIVMVTHNPQAASYANRVLFLKDGRIIRRMNRQNGPLTMAAIMDEMAKLDEEPVPDKPDA
jgi:putative ABC transport system ATP-binding protein